VYLEALAEVLDPRGMTYPEVAIAFGRSIKRVQNVVYQHGLPVTYGRIGPHPRRRVFLPPGTIRALRRYLPPPRPPLGYCDR
jgi:hypothetical protein